MRTTSRTALLGLVVAASVAVAPVAEAAPTKTVQMTSSKTFQPAKVVVTKGTAVVWRNTDTSLFGGTHTTTSNTGLWDAKVAKGRTFTRTFRKAGTFRYRCTLHLGMTGVVVVR